jgi:acetyltransferase
VDIAEGLAYLDPPKGDEVAIVTNSGGPSVVLTDKLWEHGIKLNRTPKSILNQLSFLPKYMNPNNPIDLTIDGDEELYYNIIRLLMESKWPDIIIALHVPPSHINPIDIAKSIRDAVNDSKKYKPLIPLFLGVGRWEAYRVLWEAPRMPSPYSHSSAAKLVDALLFWRKRLSRLS